MPRLRWFYARCISFQMFLSRAQLLSSYLWTQCLKTLYTTLCMLWCVVLLYCYEISSALRLWPCCAKFCHWGSCFLALLVGNCNEETAVCIGFLVLCIVTAVKLKEAAFGQERTNSTGFTYTHCLLSSFGLISTFTPSFVCSFRPGNSESEKEKHSAGTFREN